MLASVKNKYSKLAETSPGLQDTDGEFLDERENYKRKTWKPWSIKPFFLAFFICLCVTLIFAVELVLQSSMRYGGLFFDDSDPKQTQLPVKADILFNYIPTTISVVFGLIWASADHNFKRLEPFFQLSKPEGASAQNSLLLDYSYSFQLSFLTSPSKKGTGLFGCLA